MIVRIGSLLLLYVCEVGGALISDRKLVKRAGSLIDSGWSCAEAIVLVLGTELGVQHDNDPAEASPFCGGLGRLGGLCGAVSGGLFIIGRMTGRSYGDDDKPGGSGARCRALTRQFVRQFEAEAGSLLCREITGYELADPDQLRRFLAEGTIRSKCLPLVTFVCRQVRQLTTGSGQHINTGLGG